MMVLGWWWRMDNIGCLSLWCPCFVYARNKARLGQSKRRRDDPEFHAIPESCSAVDCLTYTVLSLICFAWPLHVRPLPLPIPNSPTHLGILELTIRGRSQTSNRAAIRKHYGIEGDCVGDTCTVLCCSACALAQESRELDLDMDDGV